MTVRVNVDNFRAAETARMIDNHLELGVGVNEWFHFRSPTPVEHQPVIRMNRDTVYSSALVDISEGATLTLPNSGNRYMSVMAVNTEHYINKVYREPGSYHLSVDDHQTPFLVLSARTFVDPDDPGDVAQVNELQDRLAVDANSTRPFSHPAYEERSLDATRECLLVLGEGLEGSERMFGSPADVEPTRHLIGTALGWGGLPESEAYYYVESEPRSVGAYTFTLSEVPVDAFWSVTIYNRDGYMEPNPDNSYSMNSVTAEATPDGSFVLNLAPEDRGLGNYLHVMDGWNYTLRLYLPRREVLDGTWTPPVPRPV